MPILPFIAEPLESLKARFPKALEKVWRVTLPMHDRAGLHREHLFDFESGLRLLISRDNTMDTDSPHIHVSASWETDEPNNIRLANQLVVNAYRSIGGKGILHFVGISPGGIPHWYVEDES